MKILFDSNLWISFMIGKRLSSLADVLCRHDVEVYICDQQLDEIRQVIARPKFDKLISDETRYYFFEMVYDVCFFTLTMHMPSLDWSSSKSVITTLFLLSTNAIKWLIIVLI